MNLYDKTERFVVDAFAKAKKETDIVHSKSVVRCIKLLKPDADEAMLIAGIAHDIERAFYGDWKKGSSDPDDLKKHQDLSAAKIEEFLAGSGAPAMTIARVKMLISKHEEGGDDDQNVLNDADCLSYFEDKALRHVREHKNQGKPPEEMKRKLEYIYDRIKSEKAKQIALKWHKEALRELGMPLGA